jgi:hypothetical protein
LIGVNSGWFELVAKVGGGVRSASCWVPTFTTVGGKVLPGVPEFGGTGVIGVIANALALPGAWVKT